jgi:hypothetical protein
MYRPRRADDTDDVRRVTAIAVENDDGQFTGQTGVHVRRTSGLCGARRSAPGTALAFSSVDSAGTPEWPQAMMEDTMLWILIVALLFFWILGVAFEVAAGLIHLLLVIALVLFLVNLVSGRRTTV